MIVSLGVSVSLQTRYLQKRGSVFQFAMRVPTDLVERYGQRFIRVSLKTSDEREAIQKTELLAKKYLAEFTSLRSNPSSAPSAAIKSAKDIALGYGTLGMYLDRIVEPKRIAHAQDDDHRYHSTDPKEYLSPTDLEVLQVFKEGLDTVRLSDAIKLYWQTHKRSGDPDFVSGVERDWKRLTSFFGDIPVTSITRAQAREFVDHCLSSGLKTTSARRVLNHINAVMNTAIREADLGKPNPFNRLPIAEEGKDSSETKVPTSEELKEIVREYVSSPPTATSLLVLLQIELGTRIGEVAGLGIDDVFLDHEIPHVYFRNRPWRTLKTDESERRVPVVGVALDALKKAVTLPRAGKGLFDQYAKPGGNDTASAAVNKRLKKQWGITSHSFRHAMKDRLREAGCPKDIRDAIQGHASGDIADTYGLGHTLKTMQGWLDRVRISVHAASL
jgi:integrase